METAGHELLDAYLRDWLARSSGFFVDPSVGFAEDLSGAPIGAAARRAALPDGEWLMLEKGGQPFVLAGLERRRVNGHDCYVIFEYCITGDSRVSFWERAGPGDWDFVRDSKLT
jgi:hypothetical protein